MNYSLVVQKSIQYIEANLSEQLNAESVASHAGFSPFHFHRIFQKETGTTIADYIRIRRLANAAYLLRYTDASIISIAFHFHFNAQESFSRAFKKVYSLPPGQYRKMAKIIAVQNGGGDTMESQQPNGWFLSGSNPFNYEIGIDSKVFHQGNCSGYLKSLTVEDKDEFGTMMQQFKADIFLGKRIKLSAFIKTSKLQNYCAMWMRVDNNAGDVLQFDNMYDRAIKNDTNWNHYSIVLDVPDNSSVICFGILLAGTGHIWADHFTFEEVDKSVPTTNFKINHQLQEEPVNLSFEDDSIHSEPIG